MELKKLTEKTGVKEISGNPDMEIQGIHSDSRKIQAGWLFVAVPYTQPERNGHLFIGKAIENGAVAIVCETFPESLQDNVTYIRVDDSAEALGQIASAWNGNPSARLTLVGVTGTNGKTTIATLLYTVFRKLGYKAGLLSTVTNYVDDRAVPTTNTTLGAIELNGLLAQMVEAGCDYAFMEVSSHGVAEKRIAGLQFKGGIFTNLTRDHLDYHPTFEDYRDAKKAFFDHLPADAFALTNKDDKNGLFMLQNTKADKQTYSVLSLADFKGKILETHIDGTLMSINDKEVATQFVGKFNVYNLLAVYGATVLLCRDVACRVSAARHRDAARHVSTEDILKIISALHSVAGRFQTFRSPDGYTAIVDYAHTPDALVNVLNAIHEVLGDVGGAYAERQSKVITVVGCGGNRDKGKRPIMAKESAKLSDRVILTSDNPRCEEPDDIISDMFAGLTEEDRKKTVKIADRKEAIRTACLLAQAGDVILIAGKGHEDYQEVKGVKYHFDDREIVQEIFKIK